MPNSGSSTSARVQGGEQADRAADAAQHADVQHHGLHRRAELVALRAQDLDLVEVVGALVVLETRDRQSSERMTRRSISSPTFSRNTMLMLNEPHPAGDAGQRACSPRMMAAVVAPSIGRARPTALTRLRSHSAESTVRLARRPTAIEVAPCARTGSASNAAAINTQSARSASHALLRQDRVVVKHRRPRRR